MSIATRTTELLESISRGVHNLITAGIITEGDSSPYTVALDDIRGFSVSNWSASNAVTFTMTFSDASTFAIPVAAAGSYEAAYGKDITTIAYAGTSPTFTAELLKRNI